IQYHRRLLWLLAAVICVMQALPLHLHLHHDSAGHDDGIAHAADVHLATSPDDRAHHHDAHVIDLDTDSILKSPDGDTLVPLLVLCLLTLVSIPRVRRWPSRPARPGIPPRQLYLELAPLRAPPHA
ncbi:MAG: hypothetical protein PVI50_03665, partial [Gammaproteobacteria bacterium]